MFSMTLRRGLGTLALLLVLAAAVLVAYHPAGSATLLIVMAVLWAVYALAARRLTVRTPVDWALALLALMILVTLWATALPDVTDPAVYQLVAGLFLFYAGVNFCAAQTSLGGGRDGSPSDPVTSPFTLAWGLVMAAVLLSGLALLVVQWSTKVPILQVVVARLPAAVGESVNGNVMGGTLAVLLPLPLGWLLLGWRGHQPLARLGLLLATLVVGGVLVLTQSRGAWMGAAVAAGVLLLLAGRRGMVVGLLLAALAVGGVFYLGPARVAAALLSSPNVTIDSRVEIWSRAIYMLQDFSFTGIGMGSFGRVASLLYPFFLVSSATIIPHAHNLFLQVGVDLGFPGLIAWLATLFLVTHSAWRAYRAGRTLSRPALSGLAAGLLACQVALVVHGLTDAVTWSSRPAIVVWAVWGLAVGVGWYNTPYHAYRGRLPGRAA